MVLMPAMLGFSLVRDGNTQGVLVSIGGLPVLFAFAIANVARLQAYLASRRERGAGYTTVDGAGFEIYWQLDPKTDPVVCRPEDLQVVRWNVPHEDERVSSFGAPADPPLASLIGDQAARYAQSGRTFRLTALLTLVMAFPSVALLAAVWGGIGSVFAVIWFAGCVSWVAVLSVHFDRRARRAASEFVSERSGRSVTLTHGRGMDRATWQRAIDAAVVNHPG